MNLFPRVLVVDSSGQMRGKLRRTLSVCGFTISEAPDGSAAQRFLSSHAVDLIFVGAAMAQQPEGAQLLADLRRAAPGLPVVISTGRDEKQFLSAVREAMFQN